MQKVSVCIRVTENLFELVELDILSISADLVSQGSMQIGCFFKVQKLGTYFDHILR